MKLDTSGFPNAMNLNLAIVFLISIPKIPFPAKFASETLKCFALNESRYVGIFKGADSQFDNCFLKFFKFFGKLLFQNSVLNKTLF